MYGNGLILEQQPVSRLSDLNGGFGEWLSNTWDDVKDTVVGAGADYIGQQIDELTGLPIGSEFVAPAAKDLIGIDDVSKASPEQMALAQRDARSAANEVLAKFKDMDCETMSPQERATLAASLRTYTDTFGELGMSGELNAIIAKFNIPTNCPLPTPDEIAKATEEKSFMQNWGPALGVGVATSGLMYLWKRSLLGAGVGFAGGVGVTKVAQTLMKN
jgi:hypothetical protein